MIYLDTNIFLRLIIDDGQALHYKAEQFFQSAIAKKQTLVTSHLTWFEVAWVLRSVYKRKKADVIEQLSFILEMSMLHIPQKELLRETLEYYKENNLDLEDCYHIASAQAMQAKKLKTFDKKLSTVAKQALAG